MLEQTDHNQLNQVQQMLAKYKLLKNREALNDLGANQKVELDKMEKILDNLQNSSKENTKQLQDELLKKYNIFINSNKKQLKKLLEELMTNKVFEKAVEKIKEYLHNKAPIQMTFWQRVWSTLWPSYARRLRDRHEEIINKKAMTLVHGGMKDNEASLKDFLGPEFNAFDDFYRAYVEEENTISILKQGVELTNDCNEYRSFEVPYILTNVPQDKLLFDIKEIQEYVTEVCLRFRVNSSFNNSNTFKDRKKQHVYLFDKLKTKDGTNIPNAYHNAVQSK